MSEFFRRISVIICGLCQASLARKPLNGPFRGAVFHHGGGARKQSICLNGPFPSLMSRFPPLIGRSLNAVLPLENPLENSPSREGPFSVAPYCAIPRDYLSDTPYCTLWGFWCLNMANWVRYPPPPYLSVSPLESMRSGGAIPPLKRGISAILARYPMKTRQMGAIPPSAVLSRKGIARYGGVSRTGPLRSSLKRIYKLHHIKQMPWCVLLDGAVSSDRDTLQYLSLQSNLKHGWFTRKLANHV